MNQTMDKAAKTFGDVAADVESKNLMKARNNRELSQLISNMTEEDAVIVAEVLAKKYPLILTDALGERMNVLSLAVADMQKYIKGI